jgi:uncharacterized repeat protein (TIGR01451 family)
MHAQPFRSMLFALSLIAAILFSGAALTAATRAQTPAQAELTIEFELAYYPWTSNSQESRIFYSENILVSDPEAEVACDPPSGALFTRGATRVTCTATLGEQTATNSFYILFFAGGDSQETDIEIYLIDQIPGVVYESSTFTYNVELRNNGDRRATGIVVSGTLPPQVDLIRASSNCDATQKPVISCVVPELLPGIPRSVALDVKVKSGFIGLMSLTMTAEITGEGEDIFADNNSYTRRTDVLRLGLAGNTVYVPLLRR